MSAPTVLVWTGGTATALRQALRLSADRFAEQLGASSRGVQKWVSQPDRPLSLAMSQLMDITLARATPEEVDRFRVLIGSTDGAAGGVSLAGVHAELAALADRFAALITVVRELAVVERAA